MKILKQWENNKMIVAFKLLAVLAIICFLIFLVIVACTPTEPVDLHHPYYIPTLGIQKSSGNVTITRTTTLDFAGTEVRIPTKSYNSSKHDREAKPLVNEQLQITDNYTLNNPGTSDVTCLLTYPMVYFQDIGDKWRFGVGLTRCTEWWGARSFAELLEDQESDQISSQLADGSYFSLAFPEWPVLGESGGVPETPEDALIQDWRYSVVYYLKEVIIPAEGQLSVWASFPANEVNKLVFAPTYNAANMEDFSLCIKNAEYVHFNSHNLEEEPVANCKMSLQPMREDYFIELCAGEATS